MRLFLIYVWYNIWIYVLIEFSAGISLTDVTLYNKMFVYSWALDFIKQFHSLVISYSRHRAKHKTDSWNLTASLSKLRDK